jgi:AraC-like DNA-binding protein
MRSHILKPSPALAPYVEFYIDMRVTAQEAADPTAAHRVRLYPTPGVSIAFQYIPTRSTFKIDGGDPLLCPSSSLGGYFTRPKEYSSAHEVGVFSICFKPWGLRRFTSFPLHEATNLNIDLHHAFGPPVAEIEERIDASRTVAERKALVESFLTARMAEREDRFAIGAVGLVVDSGGTMPVTAMASEAALSRKQFERRFREEVGLAPKPFSRIVRFQRALWLLRGPLRTIEVAYESGYFDQPHFNREFKELSGVTPGAYIRTVNRTSIGQDVEEAVKMSPLYNTIYE